MLTKWRQIANKTSKRFHDFLTFYGFLTANFDESAIVKFPLMKKISRVIVILPACHNLSSLPTDFTGPGAASLLANWTFAWHPSLIAATGQRPFWCSTDQTAGIDPDDELASNGDEDDFYETDEYDYDNASPEYDQQDDNYDGGPLTLAAIASQQPSSEGDDQNQPPLSLWQDAVIFIPTVSNDQLADGFAASAAGQSAAIIAGLSDRQEIAARLTTLLGMPALDEKTAECAEDFFVLGYAWLQIQLLTRQIRYSSNLNQSQFDAALVAAATAWCEDDIDAAQQKLTACHDLLLEEKNNYYPVKPDLIDLVLTAPTTLGKSLNRELQNSHPSNFFLTGDCVQLLVDATPPSDAMSTLRSRLAEGTAAIVGGNQTELPDPLLAKETTLNQIKTGTAVAEQLTGNRYSVFMRRRGGLNCDLPCILDGLDFLGAMHFTLDRAAIPHGSTGTIQWSGPGDSAIMAKSESPLNAAEPGTFLNFAVQFGKQIDSAHSATMLLTHWAGKTCPAFDDVVRISQRSNVLGSFQTLDEHFDDIYDPGYGDRFLGDEYQAGYLNEAIAAKAVAPVSSIAKYWKRFFRLSALTQLQTMICLLAKDDKATISAIAQAQQELTKLQSAIEAETENWQASHADTDARLETAEQNALQTMRQMLGGGTESLASDVTRQCSAVVNPFSFSRRIEATSSSPFGGDHALQISTDPFQMSAADQATGGTAWTCDVSSQSVVRLVEHSTSSFVSEKKAPFVQAENRLRNEFFEATIDAASGGLRSILFHGKRGNRAGQRLLMRDAAQPKVTSKMICESVEGSNLSKIAGQIKTRGRIEMADAVVAAYTQTFRLARGQRVLEVEIEIEPKQELPDSANSYFASQLAWQDEACTIRSGCQMARHETNDPKIESPNFVEISASDYRLTLLAGGLPWHQRVERCKLDTLLVVGRERQRNFRLGIGIDITHATRAAINFNSPVLTLEGVPASIADCDLPQSLHLDCKNIIVTWSEPIIESDRCVGVTLRLQETEGRSGKLNVLLPFAIASAHRQNFLGEGVETLVDDADGGKRQPVSITFSRHDYFQIEVRFAAK